jgi:catechol 2,3-dioxygenase-like lactoylglutathione lyase family enzyme
MADQPAKDVQGFFHVNVNCTDFEKSLPFYQLIGFEKILDFNDVPGPPRSFGQAGLGSVLGLPDDCDGRAALLALSSDSGSTRLDLIEWRRPRLPLERRKNLAQPGIARICFKTSDCDSVYARLSSAGYVVYSAPTRVHLGGGWIKLFCCEDPDGTVIEFMEFLGRSELPATRHDER